MIFNFLLGLSFIFHNPYYDFLLIPFDSRFEVGIFEFGYCRFPSSVTKWSLNEKMTNITKNACYKLDINTNVGVGTKLRWLNRRWIYWASILVAYGLIYKNVILAPLHIFCANCQFYHSHKTYAVRDLRGKKRRQKSRRDFILYFIHSIYLCSVSQENTIVEALLRRF